MIKAADFYVTLLKFPVNSGFQSTWDLTVPKVFHERIAKFWETMSSLVNRNVSEGFAAAIFRTVNWSEWRKTAKFTVTFARTRRSGTEVITFQRNFLPNSSILSLRPFCLYIHSISTSILYLHPICLYIHSVSTSIVSTSILSLHPICHYIQSVSTSILFLHPFCLYIHSVSTSNLSLHPICLYIHSVYIHSVSTSNLSLRPFCLYVHSVSTSILFLLWTTFSTGGSTFVWNVGAHSLYNLPGQIPG
jgi:hypothetical protein